LTSQFGLQKGSKPDPRAAFLLCTLHTESFEIRSPSSQAMR